MIFVEEIDFCLQPSVGSSGKCSKMSKALNTLSNHIAKKILIGVDFCFGVSQLGDRASDMAQRWADG